MAKPIVCVIGAGTAALEGLLCARETFGAAAQLRLVAPDDEFRYRPMSRDSLFRPAREQALAIAELVAQAGAAWTTDRADFIDDSAGTVVTRDGETVDYDFLLLAPGARPARTLRHGFVWQRGGDPGFLDRIIRELAAGETRSVAVAVPRGARWPLPAYELALVLAWTSAGSDARIVLLTAEEQPLGALGAQASEAVTRQLEDAGVETIAGVEVVDQPEHDGQPQDAAGVILLPEQLSGRPDPLIAKPSDPARVRLADGSQAEFDRLISLPTVIGPIIAGVPTDAAGFIEIDADLRVCGSERIWAAGGCVAAALEHSALSARQADAAIAAIATSHDGTREGEPAPTGPLQPTGVLELTGVLLTGQRERWLAENPPGTQEPSTRCLWWPPGRAVGRMLAERIAAWNPAIDSALPDLPDGVVIRAPVVLGCSGRHTPATSTPVSADVRAARLRDIENRQLLAIRRRELAAEAELRSLSAGLQTLATRQQQTVRELQQHGYLRDRAVPESSG
ncbi:MAG TPA: FAD/NAD(P)-binding oxidoreductase [Solirubrobacteraceae bacterium]|nr:FAD/NAD(P)-binding oxidoreductase [Solirubrobacteraceae bacterium]